MINSCLFILIKTIKNLFLYRLRRNRIQKRSAIYQNRRSKRIENTHFAFICTICTRVQINLLHLERRSKFAPGANLHPGCKFLKHRSHGQKYTRGANLHPGANCAYEHSFRELRMEHNSSIFNYMRMEPLMFDEILNRVNHRIQENDTHFRKALEPGLELERIINSWRERDEIFVSAAQSPIA